MQLEFDFKSSYGRSKEQQAEVDRWNAHFQHMIEVAKACGFDKMPLDIYPEEPITCSEPGFPVTMVLEAAGQTVFPFLRAIDELYWRNMRFDVAYSYEFYEFPFAKSVDKSTSRV